MLENLEQLDTADLKRRRDKLEADVTNPDKIITAPITLGNLEKQCEDDVNLKELLDDMVNLCARYTKTVCDMQIEGENLREEGTFADKSDERKRLHNTMIESVNILARELDKRGKDCLWIKSLTDRTKYAKLALALTLSRV